MNESKSKRRAYSSKRRADAAEATRAKILASAKALLDKKGVDKVTIAEIAARSAVAESTVYAAYKSKQGILRALMEQAMFGGEFQAAQRHLAGVEDSVELILRTPRVARAVYESEHQDLGLLRQISGFSPLLRQVEQQFEGMRFDMQKDRIERLYGAGKARRGLGIDEARRIMWMYTSRDVYRMLVIEGGWTPQDYQDWLAETLLWSLVEPGAHPAAVSDPALRGR